MKKQSFKLFPVCAALLFTSGLAIASALQPAKTPIELQPVQVNVMANEWQLKSNHCSQGVCYAQVQGDDFVVFVEYMPEEYAEPVWVTQNNVMVEDYYIDMMEFSRIAELVGV